MGDLGEIIDLARSTGLVLALAFYVSIVIWTYKDARKRTEDPIMVATFTAISMLPLFGVFIYMLVRPSEYIADVRERELEIRALERQLGRQERCPYCKSHIEGEYLSCPVCTTKLRQSCTGCQRPLDPRWVLCPFCEAEVPGRADRMPNKPKGDAGRRSGASGAPRRSTKSQPVTPRASRSSRSGGDKETTRTTTPSRGSSSVDTSKSSSKPDSAGSDIGTEPLTAGGDSTKPSTKTTT